MLVEALEHASQDIFHDTVIVLPSSMTKDCLVFNWRIQITQNILSCRVLTFLEACFDLILSPSLSMKIQIMGGKISENLGFKSPLRKVKKILFLFLFHFQILHTKMGIFEFNNFLISCLINYKWNITCWKSLFLLISDL